MMLCRITSYSGTSGSLSLNYKNTRFDNEQNKEFIIGVRIGVRMG